MTRTERQLLGIKKWVENKCKGILEYCTGVGKTYTAIMAIKKVVEKNPTASVIIVVPTTNLKEQWMEYLVEENLLESCQILILNTAAKNKYNCSLLVVDELHLALSKQFCSIFSNITHSLFLGLTATLERLDGRHQLLEGVYSIVDSISTEEALKNNWLSEYREYLVLLDVNLTDYQEANREFYEGFNFFNNNFEIALKCATDWRFRAGTAKSMYSGGNPDEISKANKLVTIASMKFMRGLKKRKQFIYCHPRKIEVANAILSLKPNNKSVVFCHTINMAEKINGKVYSGKDSAKNGRVKLDDFFNSPEGVLSSSKKLLTGWDCPTVNTLIDLDTNSSKTRKTQSIGRAIRKHEEKVSEVFTLVIKNTVEEEWFLRGIGNHSYITIDEDNLMKLLQGEEFNVKKNRETRNGYGK